MTQAAFQEHPDFKRDWGKEPPVQLILIELTCSWQFEVPL